MAKHQPVHVSMPPELKSRPSTSPTHPSSLAKSLWSFHGACFARFCRKAGVITARRYLPAAITYLLARHYSPSAIIYRPPVRVYIYIYMYMYVCYYVQLESCDIQLYALKNIRDYILYNMQVCV